jgi:hypothetical protein
VPSFSLDKALGLVPWCILEGCSQTGTVLTVSVCSVCYLFFGTGSCQMIFARDEAPESLMLPGSVELGSSGAFMRDDGPSNTTAPITAFALTLGSVRRKL